MRSASERREHAAILAELADLAEPLELPDQTIQLAQELYLLATPVHERSKRAVLASSCYTAGLVTGEERPQTIVAEAFGVSRLAIQSRWQGQLELIGLSPPDW